MIVEIICVGTEILMGNIVNTNAAYLSEQCAGLGLTMYYQSVVGDNPQRLEQLVTDAMKRSDILIFSGGLGPTQDDLTKETVAKVFGLPLVEDATALGLLIQSFERFQKPMTENNRKQALVPKGSMVLQNRAGTAPGIIIEGKQATAILLPGPPNELIPMFHEQVAPYLKTRSDATLFSKMIKIVGVGESAVETMILDLIQGQTNPTIATYAKTGEVHVRITAFAKTQELAMEYIQPLIDIMNERFTYHIFAYDEDTTLEQAIILKLKEMNATISTAESCTGGLLAGRIINASGASVVYNEGFITYSNASKVKNLFVNEASIEEYGVVSEVVAKEMAKGCRIQTGSSFALSTTGIAGPNGGTTDKPVGTVCIGCSFEQETVAKQFRLSGTREKIREVAVNRALVYLWDIIGGHIN